MASGTLFPAAKFETLSPTETSHTTNTSPIVSMDANRYGRVIQIIITFNGGSGTVNTGSNAYDGYISGVPLPSSPVNAATYLGSTILFATFFTDGRVTVRILAANKGNASAYDFYEQFIYLV